jgi:hypothetical protein
MTNDDYRGDILSRQRREKFLLKDDEYFMDANQSDVVLESRFTVGGILSKTGSWSAMNAPIMTSLYAISASVGMPSAKPKAKMPIMALWRKSEFAKTISAVA